jgi:hypothetical protein
MTRSGFLGLVMRWQKKIGEGGSLFSRQVDNCKIVQLC